MAKIDDLDLRIIKELQKNARQSYREIAAKLNVAEGTVYNRVSKLKDLGVIKRFLVDVDYSKIGYDLTALIGIKVGGGHLPEIEEMVSKEKNVTAVYDVTGEYDAIAVVKFRDRAGLSKLVKKILAIPHVERTYTMVALNVIKEEHGVEI